MPLVLVPCIAQRSSLGQQKEGALDSKSISLRVAAEFFLRARIFRGTSSTLDP